MESSFNISKRNDDFKQLQDLDFACKKEEQFIGRYVSVGFTDRTSLYVVVDAPPQKYLLRFAWGESVYPSWGNEIKLSKTIVKQMIIGRDRIESIFPHRI